MWSCWLWTAVISLGLWAGTRCSQFSQRLPNHTAKFVCRGNTAILPWTVLLDPGETVDRVEWIFKGHTDHSIGLFSQGAFAVSTPYSQRASILGNAGITIVNVGPADSGDYMVKATVTDINGTQRVMENVATLSVIDDIVVGGQLQVKQWQHATNSSLSDEWGRMELACGPFVYPGSLPPFHLHWTDPTGHTLPSSGYGNGYFHLTLGSPVLPGEYTCRVPSAVVTCRRSNDPVLAHFTVDPVVVLVTTLEGRQKQLLQERTRLQQDASALETRNRELRNSVAGLKRTQQVLTQQQETLKQTVNQLQVETQTSSSAMAGLLQRLQAIETLRRQHQTSSSSPDLHNLQTCLDQLSQASAQCCQKRAALSQENSDHRQRSTTLGQHLESLTRDLNHTSDRWTSHVQGVSAQIEWLEKDISLSDNSTQTLEALRMEAEESHTRVVYRLSGTETELTALSNHAKLALLDGQLTTLQTNQTNSRLGFHVRMGRHDNEAPGDEGHLVYTEEITNEGKGYHSGVFRAPRDGVYLVVVTMSAPDRNHYAMLSMVRNQNEELDYGHTYTVGHSQSSALHAVVYLREKDTVTLVNHDSASRYRYHYGSFSGALLTQLHI